MLLRKFKAAFYIQGKTAAYSICVFHERLVQHFKGWMESGISTSVVYVDRLDKLRNKLLHTQPSVRYLLLCKVVVLDTVSLVLGLSQRYGGAFLPGGDICPVGNCTRNCSFCSKLEVLPSKISGGIVC